MEEQMIQQQKEKQRSIETVTTEIRTLCRQAQQMLLSYAIEIGRRLIEAKEMLPHGEWGVWLKEEVDFSQSSANNFMRLFEEYGEKQVSLFGAELNSQTFGNLTYSKALKLIALPSEERESFAKENDIENMSTRELDKLIKERDEALKKAERVKELELQIEKAKAEAEEYKKNSSEQGEITEDLRNEIDELKAMLEKAKKSEKTAQEKLKEIKDNPELSEDVLNKIREQAEADAAEKQRMDLEKRLTEANTKIAEAKSAEEAARKAETAANKKIEDLKKQLQMSNSDVTEFKTLFEQTQENVTKMVQITERIEDKELSEKLSSAMNAFLKKYVS